MADFYVSKLPDKSILDMLADLKEKFGAQHSNIDLGGIALGEEEYELLRKKKGPSFLIQSFSYSPSNRSFSVGMNRGNILPSLNPAYHDIIRFDLPNGQATVAVALEAEEVLRRHLTFSKGGDAKALAESTIGIIDRETALLAELHHKMMDNAEDLRLRYEMDAIERRKTFEEQQLLAEEELRKREAESIERIEAEKTALDEKLKQFDLTDHMRARRRQREEITAQIQVFLQRPQGPPSSQAKLMALISLTVLISGFSAFVAYESLAAFISQTGATSAVALDLLKTLVEPKATPTSEMVSTTQAAAETSTRYLLWMFAIRGITATAIALGFAYNALNLLRRSYDDEMRTSRELQRYGMDINRASWVIETAMEMTTKENAQLPEKWIEGACAGLFQTSASEASETNSLSALGAVLGLGPEIEAGPNGVNMKFSKAASKAAAKDG